MTKQTFKKMTRWKAFRDKGKKCFYCLMTTEDLRELGVLMTVDHVTPKSKGGTNASDNLVTACGRCNNAKSDSLGWFEGCVATEAFGNPEWYRDILLNEEAKELETGKRKNEHKGDGGIEGNNSVEGIQGKWRYDEWKRGTGPNV